MKTAHHESFSALLHGTARAWRLKLDERLRPLGMSQARWRTLLHLSIADAPVHQAELAARLGIEEPTMANSLLRLEQSGWVKRVSAAHDRRCKMVKLQPRAKRIITTIDATARTLREELTSGISATDLQTCMRVLSTVRTKAEGQNGNANGATKNG